MNKLLSLLTVVFLSFSYLQAQEKTTPAALCSSHKIRFAKAAKLAVADPAEDNYDVRYVKLDVQLDNLSTAIKGVTTTKASVLINGFSQYVFELRSEEH